MVGLLKSALWGTMSTFLIRLQRCARGLKPSQFRLVLVPSEIKRVLARRYRCLIRLGSPPSEIKEVEIRFGSHARELILILNRVKLVPSDFKAAVARVKAVPSPLHAVLFAPRVFPPLLAAPGLSAAPDKVVEVKPSVVQGTWGAWGCSLCWWAKIFGDRDDLADLFFTTKTVTLDGRDLPGLGMNYARYNAGACSWNEIDGRKMVVSKTIPPYRQVEGFWLDGKNADPDSASWNWSADAKQRATLLKARDRGANFFELFSNSPMWRMCANHNPSGAGGVDNLRRGQEKKAVSMSLPPLMIETSLGYFLRRGI
jgi:hypothetical protein